MPPLSQPLGGKQHDGQTPGLRRHHHAMALLRHNAHRSASSRAPHADLDTFHLSQLCDAASSQQVRQTASGTTEDYPPRTRRKRESLGGPAWSTVDHPAQLARQTRRTARYRSCRGHRVIPVSRIVTSDIQLSTEANTFPILPKSCTGWLLRV